MSDPRDPLQSLWTAQQEEPFAMSLADIHTRAARFQSRIRWRNWIEYAASAIVVVAFAWTALVIGNTIMRMACGLIIAGTLYVTWKLGTLARSASTRETDETANWAAFHRAELVRQRDALRGIWRWYLGPLVPGMTLFWIGVALTPRGDAPWWVQVGVALMGAAIGAAMFFGIAQLNLSAAKKLDEEIAALDRAEEL
jgi:hypothetical protein